MADEMVTAAAEAIEELAIPRIGRDLGTIHRDDIVAGGVAAALQVMADEIDRWPTIPVPPSAIAALVRERADRLTGATDPSPADPENREPEGAPANPLAMLIGDHNVTGIVTTAATAKPAKPFTLKDLQEAKRLLLNVPPPPAAPPPQYVVVYDPARVGPGAWVDVWEWIDGVYRPVEGEWHVESSQPHE